MKSGRILLMVAAFFCFMGIQVHAAVENIYEPQTLEMNQQFQSLLPLEQLVEQQPLITLEDIRMNPNLNLKNISFYMPSDSSGGFRQRFGKLDPMSFGVGFCCWPYGIGYILVTGEATKEQKRSYCAGVVTSVLGGVVLSIIDSGLSFNFWDSLVNAFSVF